MAHPTIIDAERVFTANPVASDAIVLPATFPVFTKDGITTDADLAVYIDGVFKPDSEWSFEGSFTAGVSAGGTVRLDAAVTATVVVVGILGLAPRRVSDFGEGNVKTAALNTEFDRLWAAMREQKHRIDRAPKIPIPEADSDDTPVDQVIPGLAARANKVSGFDALGRPAVSTRSLDSFNTGALPANAIVATMTALRDLTPAAGDVAYMQGHQSAGDGGGGVFRWDDTSADADDNGLTILPTGHMGNGRWKRIIFDFVTPQMFGAAGNGTGNDGSELQAVIDTELHVLLNGSYRITSGVVIPSGWRGSITGAAGPGKLATINAVGAITALDLTDLAGKNGCAIRGIRINGDQTAGQIGIDAKVLRTASILEDLWIANCDIGVRLADVFYCKSKNVRITDCVTAGLAVVLSTGSAVNSMVFDGWYIEDGINCVSWTGTGASSHDITFIGCTFEKSKKTAFVGENINVTFIGCHFESNYSDARDSGPDTLTSGDAIDIKVSRDDGNPKLLNVWGCLFAHASGWNTSTFKSGVRVGDGYGLDARGNEHANSSIDFWYFHATTALTPVLGHHAGVSLPGNLANPIPPALANSATPSVQSDYGAKVWHTSAANTYTNITNAYRGQIITVVADHAATWTHGTNVFLRDAKNWTMPVGASITLLFDTGNVWRELSRSGDCLSGSATYDPPSLVDGAGATTTVTVTGAALGDYVEGVSFSNDLQGITVTAWVSAADTVSVRFQNESGGTLDLSSGTLRARVRNV